MRSPGNPDRVQVAVACGAAEAAALGCQASKGQMMNGHKLTVAVLVVLLAKCSARADATLEPVVSNLGGGLYGVQVWVHGNDGQQLSFFADLRFTGEQLNYVCLPGEIQQMKASGGVDVDSDADAMDYHGVGTPPYDMWRDSWFYEPWPSNCMGILEAPNYYAIGAGTGGAQFYEDLLLAYLCTTGDIAYDGYIARQGVLYDMAGVWCVPVPIPGDTQPDGCVDGLDYNRWSVNYLASGVPARSAGGHTVGNFNEDTTVDGLDYNIWSLHYQEGCGAGAQVPEPSCALLIVVGTAGMLRRRRRWASSTRSLSS